MKKGIKVLLGFFAYWFILTLGYWDCARAWICRVRGKPDPLNHRFPSADLIYCKDWRMGSLFGVLTEIEVFIRLFLKTGRCFYTYAPRKAGPDRLGDLILRFGKDSSQAQKALNALLFDLRPDEEAGHLPGYRPDVVVIISHIRCAGLPHEKKRCATVAEEVEFHQPTTAATVVALREALPGTTVLGYVAVPRPLYFFGWRLIQVVA